MKSSQLTRAAVVLGLLAWPSLAQADRPAEIPEPAPPPPEAPDPNAEAVRREADLAMSRGQVDEACRLLDGLTKAEHPRALIDAGKCFALAGRTASAYRRYTRATIAAASRNERDVEDRARDLATKLAPSLSKLRIDVQGPADDLAVTLNGAPVPKTEWGVLGHADPGSLVVRATAAGRAPFETTLTLGPNGDAKVVVIPPLPAADATPLNPPKKDDPPLTDPPQTPEDDGRVSPIGIAAFVTTAFGVVGVGTGIAFGVMTLSEVGEAEENAALCPNKLCSEAGRSVIDEAETKGIISTAAFAIGGASLATGATLFLLREFGVIDQPKSAPKAPEVSAGLGGVGLTLRFD